MYNVMIKWWESPKSKLVQMVETLSIIVTGQCSKDFVNILTHSEIPPKINLMNACFK